ncbi:MAG: glycosyltransferase [Thermoplasmata archaeon]
MPGSPKPSPTPPAISIVVTAWNRRAFLREAVQSAAAPPEPAGGREIVVVKNFEEPLLDRDLAAMGARLVLDREPAVGASVARGLAEARAPVLCFLDDDDRFAPGKVAAVAEAFARDPSLVLLRNGWRPIDVRGEPIPGWPIHDWPAAAPRRPVVLRTEAEKRASRILPMYNLSTMSVRRDALLPWAGRFRPIPAASDSLVVLASLASGGTVAYDPRPWTLHRIHASTSRETLGADGIRPPAGPEYLSRSVAALRAQEAMVLGTAAEPWAHWVYLIARFDGYLGLPDASPPTPREHWEFLLGALRERQRFRLPPLAFSLLRRPFPHWAFAHWWGLRRFLHAVETRDADRIGVGVAREEAP